MPRMNIRCSDMEELAILYACGETDPPTRTAIELHAGHCHACASILSRELSLHAAIASFDDPAELLDRSGLLLAQCRSRLAESLDDLQVRSNPSEWRAMFSPVQWWLVLRNTLVYHPALSMIALVVTSFLAGVAGQRMRVAPVILVPARSESAIAATVPATLQPASADTPRLTEQQLQSAGSANVQWVTPSSTRTPQVQVQLMSPTPMSIVGSTDDYDVRRALTYVLSHDQRFDSNARMDSLEVLRMCAADPDVRSTLCTAARSDHHPAVRIKALEALQGREDDPIVRQTLLDVLQNDVNAGVRIEAINQLLSGLHLDRVSGPANPQIVSALRDAATGDPNDYIRLESTAALQQLGAGRVH
jgi:hypothetical protein